MYPYFPVGSIISFNAKKGGWFSTVQRFFTGKPYTHSAIVVPDVVGVPSYLGADLTVDIQPIDVFLDSETIDYQVWEWIGIPVKRIMDALQFVYLRYAGETYGFLQVLWFVYSWFMRKVFRKDVRKTHNPFPNHPICSEVTWWMCYRVVYDNPKLVRILNEWRPDTFSSGDQAEVMKRFAAEGAVRKRAERWTIK